MHLTKQLWLLFIGLIYCCTQGTAQDSTAQQKGAQKLQLGTAATSFTGKKYALIVGVSSYIDKKLNKLNYAHTDAAQFKQLVESGYMGKFEEVKYLTENNATYASVMADAIVSWLNDLKTTAQKGDEIFIYYSGHGIITSGGQNFMCHDSKINDQNISKLQSIIPFTMIRTMVSELVSQEAGVKVTYVLDACRVADATDQPVSGDIKSANQLFEKNLSYGENVLYSASNEQYSYETNKLHGGNGIFTFFLRLGLMGAADNNPPDNRISMSEITKFVTRNVEDYVSNVLKKQQVPTFMIEKEVDRQRIISVLLKDTVSKYKDVYKKIKAGMDDAAKSKQPIADYFAAKGITLSSNYATSNEAYASINSVEIIDSASSEPLYDSLLYAVEENHLIEPRGASAYDYYQRIKIKNSNPKIIKQAKSKLFVSLISKTQLLIDNYLVGKAEDRSKHAFDIAYKELKLADTLMDTKNPYRDELVPKLYFLQARALAGSTNPRDWDAGLTIIDSALKVAPQAAYSYYTKAILYKSKHRYFTAIKLFTKATELAPGWIYAQYNLAQAYYDVAEYAKSISLCHQIIAKEPNYAEAYTLIALNYENVKMYDSAIHWNKESIAIDASNVTAYNNISRVYLKGQDFNQQKSALANYYIYTAAQQFSNTDAMTTIGKRLMERKLYDSAQYYFNNALQLDGFHLSAIENLARLFSITGNTAKADALLFDAAKRMGNDSRIYAVIMAYKHQQRLYASADSVFRLVVNINHEDPSLFINYSKLLEDRGLLNESRNTLHEGFTYVNNSPSIIFNLANLFFKHHRNTGFTTAGLDSALYYFNRSLSITPNYSFTYFGLYQVYLANGSIDKAFQSLDKARELNQYIQTITNYNPDIMALVDKAIKAKEYTLSIRYAKIALSFTDDFKTNWKLALCYHLAGEQDSAYSFITKTAAMAKVKSQQKEQLQLLGNILFDKGNYVDALVIFEKVDEQNTFPNYLEQAACYVMMGNAAQATKLYEEGKANDATAKDSYINLEGTRYSNKLIAVIKNL
jgi:tetratricopeptide (TPR) repeat protein